ncbi:MAG: hypothetical protein O2857_22535 [Planctomycetota bacterium]|nr:hypothetical protein [Planctomycetota bacterium]
MRRISFFFLSLSMPHLAQSDPPDLTELEGRWYTQSYWQQPEIQQDYTFEAFKTDQVNGDSVNIQGTRWKSHEEF